MTIKRLCRDRGVTLVELMVAMAVLAIAALGALSYQYHSARHARIAKLEMTATRTGQLLLEDWKSTGGDANYDPATLGLGFEQVSSPNLYKIAVDELLMYIRLTYNDIAHDAVAGVTLREISVIIRWRADCALIEPTALDPSLVLTTYVRLDASGG